MENLLIKDSNRIQSYRIAYNVVMKVTCMTMTTTVKEACGLFQVSEAPGDSVFLAENAINLCHTL